VTGALDGLVIADFGRVLAGPYATMMLADLGAEVIKIERPGTGDDTRSWGPPWGSKHSTYFESVNRNKRSLALDLTDPDDLASARKVTLRADVVVENFLPETMNKFGLGYDYVARVNPAVIYCSITGFGGANQLPGYDLLIQAVGGLMSITGPGPQSPTKVGVALVDVITGLHAVTGILAALHHRDRTGEGQRVEVNLLSSLLSALTNQSSGYVGAGIVPRAMGNAHPSVAPYEMFDTADRPLVVAVGNDRQFASLSAVLGVPGLAEDPRFACNSKRVAHQEPLRRILQQALRGKDADSWFAALTAESVPCGPVNDIAEAIALATRLGLEPVVEIAGDDEAHWTRVVANPLRLSTTPPTYRLPPPSLGQHNASSTPLWSRC
jgi:crotonobetainyl-CoA:carnitine CoA-transferase CaiB-like acyl-CoA transferase